MKLSAMLFLSLDGVYQGPGRPGEDRRGGFERGGWVAPYGHEEVWRFIDRPSDLRNRWLTRRNDDAVSDLVR
jgi:hypothetical protein